MALIPTCNDGSGGTFCASLNDCVIQNLGNVDFTNVTGCTQTLVLGTNGIVTPVTDTKHYLRANFSGGVIPHPATIGVPTVVQVPFNNLLQNDFCEFTPDGVTIEITQTGNYFGQGALLTNGYLPVPPSRDITNVQLDILMTGATTGTLARNMKLENGWTFPAPFHVLTFTINPFVTIQAGTFLEAYVLAEGRPFNIQFLGINLWKDELCLC